MATSYIVSFVGDDRPGLVEQLAGVIGECGGNWHESRLSKLGGKFAGLVLVTLPGDLAEDLEAQMRGLAESGLSVRITPTEDIVQVGDSGREITLTVVGPDRPGIVREISRALAQRRINVTEMDSAVASAPMSAELLFQATIVGRVPEDTDIEGLTEQLDEIANQMTLDIDLE